MTQAINANDFLRGFSATMDALQSPEEYRHLAEEKNPSWQRGAIAARKIWEEVTNHTFVTTEEPS
jgi:hypothetical protein